MAYYSSKLRLYDSNGNFPFIIDQEKSGSTNTHIETLREGVEFNKKVAAPDFETEGGGKLSSLNSFGDIDLKVWINERTGAGDNGAVVNPSSTGQDGTYTTIQAAVDALPDGGVILVRAGTYTGTVLLDSQKSVSIIGEDRDRVIISPLAGMAATAILQPYSLSTRTYALKNLTIQSCGTAISCDGCNSVRLENIAIFNAGWDGTPSVSDDQSSYAALYSNVISSWAIDVSNCSNVSINDIKIHASTRGARFTDCSGHVRNIDVYDTLGTGIELGASSGDGSSGCVQTRLSDCTVRCARGNGIVITGGGGSQLTGCVLDTCWLAGIYLHNSVHCDAVSCIIARCNTRSYSGFGISASGNADGSIVVRGNAGVVSSDYTLNMSGSTVSCGGSGSLSSAYALFAADLDSTVNVSGCGYICFDPLYRVNNLSIVQDSQLSWIASQIHSL